MWKLSECARERQRRNFHPIPQTSQTDCQSFLDSINRGGLIKPSAIVNDACVAAWESYYRIMDNVESKKQFLASKHHWSVFIKFGLIYLKSTDKYDRILSSKCVEDHPFTSILEKIVGKSFNVMVKNFVSETNSVTHSLAKQKMKKVKLTSSSVKIR